MMRPSQIKICERKRERIRADPEKHKRQKEYQRKWYKKHPPTKEKLEKAKKYLNEMRKLSKEIGNCVVCFKVKEKGCRFLTCGKCREKIRERYFRKQMKKPGFKVPMDKQSIEIRQILTEGAEDE